MFTVGLTITMQKCTVEKGNNFWLLENRPIIRWSPFWFFFVFLSFFLLYLYLSSSWFLSSLHILFNISLWSFNSGKACVNLHISVFGRGPNLRYMFWVRTFVITLFWCMCVDEGWRTLPAVEWWSLKKHKKTTTKLISLFTCFDLNFSLLCFYLRFLY